MQGPCEQSGTEGEVEGGKGGAGSGSLEGGVRVKGSDSEKTKERTLSTRWASSKQCKKRKI